MESINSYPQLFVTLSSRSIFCQKHHHSSSQHSFLYMDRLLVFLFLYFSCSIVFVSASLYTALDYTKDLPFTFIITFISYIPKCVSRPSASLSPFSWQPSLPRRYPQPRSGSRASNCLEDWTSSNDQDSGTTTTTARAASTGIRSWTSTTTANLGSRSTALAIHIGPRSRCVPTCSNSSEQILLWIHPQISTSSRHPRRKRRLPRMSKRARLRNRSRKRKDITVPGTRRRIRNSNSTRDIVIHLINFPFPNHACAWCPIESFICNMSITSRVWCAPEPCRQTAISIFFSRTYFLVPVPLGPFSPIRAVHLTKDHK